MSRAPDGELTLGRAVAARTADGLEVEFELTARGPRAVWLCGLFETEPSGRYRLAPARAYLEVRPPGTVVLSRALWPVPAGVRVEFPEVPCLQRLEAGRTESGRIVVSTPVRASHPYAWGDRPGLALDQVGEVVLRLGYLPDVPGLSVRRGTDAGGLPFVCPEYFEALRLQQVVSAVLEV